MKLKNTVTGLALLMIVISGQAMAQENAPPAQTMEEISVEGRLRLESFTEAEKEELILQGKDAKTYRILGSLTEELTSLLKSLGEYNLVSLEGLKSPFPAVIHCEHSYQFDEEGNKTVDTECIPYYNLTVKKIVASQASAEELPPPETDKQEETRIRKSALLQMQEEGLIKLGSVEGKVSDLSIRTPIKTVEVTYSDKDDNPVKKVFLITSHTVTVKKTSLDEEPLYVTEASLRVGQKVNVEYSSDERLTEALFVTILKD